MGKHVGLAFVGYFFGLLGGIVVYLVAEKKDRFTRFHAMQSILFNLAALAVAIVLMATMFASMFPLMIAGGTPATWFAMPAFMGLMAVWMVYAVVAFIIWLILLIKVYGGETYKLPVIGQWAEDWTK
ncbi:MAG: DUF4870 domain-containing protein [Candidatus Aenigmarchaeota archaeon]|nr:DUF4870 domain-containing protein [Candidatus Aenigmarchaeota archaeon]